MQFTSYLSALLPPPRDIIHLQMLQQRRGAKRIGLGPLVAALLVPPAVGDKDGFRACF